MCRWLAYSGSPILIKEALYEGPTRWSTRACTRGSGPSRPTATGSASAGTATPERRASSTAPSRPGTTSNLRELAGHISSPLFFTHIRAAIGSAVQQTNCHPFRHDRWLFMHNGYINEFAHDQARPRPRRRPVAVPGDPGPGRHRGAVLPRADVRPRGRSAGRDRAAIGLVEAVASRHGVPNPFQGTIATTDGETTWAFRYSSERKSRSLFYTTDVPTLRKLYPERQLLPSSRRTRG